MSTYRPGDVVVYAKEKHSTHPGHRARSIRPAPRGEEYTYVVDKYWMVIACADGELELRTPGGKFHRIRQDDPHLRRPTWRERLWLRLRAPDRLAALRGH